MNEYKLDNAQAILTAVLSGAKIIAAESIATAPNHWFRMSNNRLVNRYNDTVNMSILGRNDLQLWREPLKEFKTFAEVYNWMQLSSENVVLCASSNSTCTYSYRLDNIGQLVLCGYTGAWGVVINLSTVINGSWKEHPHKFSTNKDFFRPGKVNEI